jgi:beta-glucanase (GH16 family)
MMARRARRLRGTVLLVVVLAFLAFVAVFAVQSPGGETGPSPEKGELLFRDDFTGTSLNSDRWSPCYWWATRGCTNLSNNELEWYVPEQVKVADGRLRLEARARQVTGIEGRRFDYVSGLISNLSPRRDLFSFQYGYVESRVRVPVGQGLWPALWMLPTTRASLPEVDIMEIVGEEPDVVAMHTHWLEDGKERQHGHRYRGPDFSAGWHTFGLQWEPDALTWYVDGEARWRVTRAEQVPNEPMYLVANLAVGGNFTRAPNRDTELPASFEVDYIKVWGPPVAAREGS